MVEILGQLESEKFHLWVWVRSGCPSKVFFEKNIKIIELFSHFWDFHTIRSLKNIRVYRVQDPDPKLWTQTRENFKMDPGPRSETRVQDPKIWTWTQKF